jgi:hypothetical protein
MALALLCGAASALLLAGGSSAASTAQTEATADRNCRVVEQLSLSLDGGYPVFDHGVIQNGPVNVATLDAAARLRPSASGKTLSQEYAAAVAACRAAGRAHP